MVPQGGQGPDPQRFQDMLAEIRRDDEWAWAEMLRLWDPRLRGLIWRLLPADLKKLELLEDILQDSWVKVARHVESFRGDCEMSWQSWLFQIGRRSVDDHRRLLARIPWPEDPGVMSERRAKVKGEDDPLDVILAWEWIDDALSTLRQDEREAVVLVDWAGWSIKEASHTMGLEPKAFYGRLRRGRAHLWDALRRGQGGTTA